MEANTPLESVEHAGKSFKGKNGWDGKLRVAGNTRDRDASESPDHEKSDEEIVPGESIDADEDLLEDFDENTDELNLVNCRIKAIANLHLERFTKLERICLRQNQISRLKLPSSFAETLEDLDMYDNSIGHIGGLEAFLNLKCLDLSFNTIKHIKNLNHLLNLEEVFLLQNKIGRIEGLSGMGKLKNVELAANRIRTIENLDGLGNLQELWLGKNKIVEISNLSHLQNLKILSLPSNRISHISGVSSLVNLEELYLSHNSLTTISGLEQNLNIRTLDITSNDIVHLEGLTALHNLEELWASSNKLSSFDEVEKELRNKQHLTTVYFEGNPLQSQQPALYRNKVRLALPNIQKIDASRSNHESMEVY